MEEAGRLALQRLGNDSLLHAARQGHLKIAQVLLDGGAKLNPKKGPVMVRARSLWLQSMASSIWPCCS
ncbi:MAG: hypothetical protein CM1200mP14_06800 [Gammaproteobacteria bacterium]|nr:MAG: hypothetical protein CM1200mP14_06800 [Gammaproteobacteria bacterium]